MPLLTIVIVHVELGKFYDTDINGEDLSTEVCDCRMLLNIVEAIFHQRLLWSFCHLSYHMEMMYSRISALHYKYCLHCCIYRQLRTLFQQSLSYLRSSMGQDRFSNLALLSIERETLECINFDEVIDMHIFISETEVRRIHL